MTQKKTYEYKKEVTIEKFSPAELYEKFVEQFSKSKWPGRGVSWTTPMLNLFSDMGKAAGYVTRNEIMRIDLTWHVEMPNVNYIELALEYEDYADVPEALVEEVRKKLIHVKSYLKCLVGWFEKKSEEEFIKQVQDLVQFTEIKDPAKWVLILLRWAGEARVEIVGYEGDFVNGDFRFQKIGSRTVEILRS
jgi:hypothetical protein